jgi:hypothetical protein
MDVIIAKSAWFYRKRKVFGNYALFVTRSGGKKRKNLEKWQAFVTVR